jgi:two-component system, sporulation sensor kinase B
MEWIPMYAVKDMILQVLFILIPTLLYFSVEHKTMRPGSRYGTLKRQVVMGILGSISVFLCLTYTVELEPGFIYDLRIVPVLFTIFYGGMYAGAITTACFFAYRIYIGGYGAPIDLLGVIPILFLSGVLVLLYKSGPANRKLIVMSGLSVLASFFCASFQYLMEPVSITRNLSLHLYIFPIIQLSAVCFNYLVAESFMEKQLAERQYELTEKVKLAGQISASIAHEVRNPLTVIKGFLSMMDTREVSAEKKKEYLQICMSEVERAEYVINDYLKLTKSADASDEAFDVCEQLHHCMSIMQSFSLMNGVDIFLEAPERGLVVKGNREKFSQVIVNMVKNGVEAAKMRDQGMVTISLFKKDQVLVRIQDNGMGIEREKLERIGRTVFTTKASGTGLGLMVCFQIIQSMQGRIEVSSEAGQGTEFVIRLPAA